MQMEWTLEDVFNVLIELEKRGAALYERLSESATDLEGQKLFKQLMVQEGQHQALYSSWKAERYEEVSVDEAYGEYLSALVKAAFAMLSEAAERHLSHSEGLKAAIELEKETLLFLTECDKLMGGSRSDIIEKVMNEERKHLKMLYQLMV